MRISARGIAKGPLTETSVHASTGEVTVVPVESGQRPTLLALILSGRMAPDAGEVTIDGQHDPRALRTRVAVVDAPDASAPADGLSLAAVVREELTFAGIRRPQAATRRLIADEGLADHARTPISELSPSARTRVLTRTAASHPDVDALILVTPDRHGGDASGWLGTANAWAARGYAVIVLASAGSIAQPERTAR
ncbi:hypothetical protein [Microbacterium amylolyticum]|uniref:ABC-type taurine transport system ATPase subunit n=1 Tax=Microbacterium amylolyticum TaxID=936337 RepID=A0ABS4ZJ01_9MICO|nr:hypothetical protein [Microbacterium amylolyticum]MBP2437013.1 ABC-type taurine transport system ATPase subunit [Microbacterium amylolyticum]